MKCFIVLSLLIVSNLFASTKGISKKIEEENAYLNQALKETQNVQWKDELDQLLAEENAPGEETELARLLESDEEKSDWVEDKISTEKLAAPTSKKGRGRSIDLTEPVFEKSGFRDALESNVKKRARQ